MAEENEIGLGVGGGMALAYQVQMRLIEGLMEGEGELTERHLVAAAWVLSSSDYADVVTERSIAGHCGYALCRESLPLVTKDKKDVVKYRISLSQHRVYDLQERANFCSDRCLLLSRAFQASLPDRRPSASFHLSRSRRQELSRLFALSFSFDKDLDSPPNSNSNSNSNAPPSLLTPTPSHKDKDKEQEQDLPLEAWLGPSDAIEGYVPKSNSNAPPSSQQLLPTPSAPHHNLDIDPNIHLSHTITHMFDSLILTDHNTTSANSKTKPIKHHNPKNPSSSTTSPSPSPQQHHHPHATTSNIKSTTSNLKSSLKKNHTSTSAPPSVRWADQQPTYAPDDPDHAALSSLRLASAHACAAALTHASQILSSSNSAADDAGSLSQLSSP